MAKFDKGRFIERAEAVHGKRYDYSKCHETRIREGSRPIKLVHILCIKHGDFWQQTSNHLTGKGCSTCGREATSASKQDSAKSFIKKAREVHGALYDYGSIVYVDSMTDVSIECKIHGSFNQRPNNHLVGKGCPRCAIEARPDYKTITRKKLLVSGLKIHTTMDAEVYHATSLQVECGVHGRFTVKANSAIKGCYRCIRDAANAVAHTSRHESLATQFQQTMHELYGDQYDCAQVMYTTAKTPVTLVCKDHGVFTTSPNAATAGKSTSGVVRMPCKECRGTGRIKKATICGKEFEYRGYEATALRFLIEEKGVRVDDVVVGNKVPKIPLRFKARSGYIAKQHWPDIFVKSRNLIVEVKSTATFGLTAFHGDSDDRIRLIQHKSICAKRLGYDYRVMLFTGKNGRSRLPLPRNWDSMTVKELRAWFKML